MASQPPQPRLLAVTVEWHTERRGIWGRVGGLGPKGRRALALVATALIAAAGAAMVADSPSSGTPPRAAKPSCVASSSPRVFVNVPARYAAAAVRGPTCP